MRTLLLAGAAFGCLMMGPQTARADSPIYTFSGSGASGTLVGSQEFWAYGGSSPPATSDVGWGSPGVSANTTTYGETIPATDFEITFNSATIDASQLNIVSDCRGQNTGGVVFCSAPGGVPTQWTPTLVGNNSIVFDAPAGVQLNKNDIYFVNIFLSPGTGVSGGSFSGDWSGSAVPEPASMSVLGAGLFALGWVRRRRK